jgi:predicted RNase H-like nuclease (RuvC/YqgF family)
MNTSEHIPVNIKSKKPGQKQPQSLKKHIYNNSEIIIHQTYKINNYSDIIVAKEKHIKELDKTCDIYASKIIEAARIAQQQQTDIQYYTSHLANLNQQIAVAQQQQNNIQYYTSHLANLNQQIAAAQQTLQTLTNNIQYYSQINAQAQAQAEAQAHVQAQAQTQQEQQQQAQQFIDQIVYSIITNNVVQ